MSLRKVWIAAEMELMTPDERARLVRDGLLDSLDDVDPEFQARDCHKDEITIRGVGVSLAVP